MGETLPPFSENHVTRAHVRERTPFRHGAGRIPSNAETV